MADTIILSLLVRDCLTNSEVQVLTVHEYFDPDSMQREYHAEAEDLLTGGLDGHYDLDFPEIHTLDEATSRIADYFAHAKIRIITPLFDPLGIFTPS